MDRMVGYGFALHVALRKRAIEAQARYAITRGTRQIVVIGSGFDSLALRLAREFETVGCFELDRAGTIALKQRALARARFEAPSHLRFVACDLGENTLQDVLSQQPAFDRTVPTFYVAEGLTMYLTEQENRALFSAVRACSEVQCTLAFTAIETLSTVGRPSALLRDKLLKRDKSRFSWCIAPADVDSYLRGVGLTLQSVTTYQQLQSAFRTAPERLRLERVSGEHVYIAQGPA